MTEERKRYWQKWYVAVIAFLLLQIVAYYAFTVYYN